MTATTRLETAAKRFILKYVFRECIEGVVKIEHCPYPESVCFMIRDIGPSPNGFETIYCAIPNIWEPFTDIELWVHEFVEHVVANLLLQIGFYGKVCFGSMTRRVPMRHFVTCLSTFSAVHDETSAWHLEPDEFISTFTLTEFME